MPARLSLAAVALTAATHLDAQSASAVLASFTGPYTSDGAPSPDGRWLARSSGKRTTIYNFATRADVPVAPVEAWEFSWAPRQNGLAFVRGDDAGEGEYVWYVAIDSATGRPREAPHRVTIGKGEFPAISNDGKVIAFSAPDTGRARLIKTVSVNGGAERVLARVPVGIDALAWLPGDRSLVFSGPVPGKPNESATIKLDLRSGKQQVIGPTRVWVAGVTRDHLGIVVVPASSPVKAIDRAILIDTAGRERGRAPLPVGDISQYAGVVGDSSLIWVQIVDRKSIEIASADGSSPRRLPVIGRSNVFPRWSPGGERLSFLAQLDGAYRITVADGNGGSPRVYRNTAVRQGESAVAWSPDARMLAYQGDDTHSIWLLDLANGSTKRIYHDEQAVPGNMRFLSDGRTIRFTAGRGTWRGTMNEVSTDGTSRTLAPLDDFTAVAVLPDGRTFLRRDSTAEVVDLAGNAPPRRIAGLVANRRMPVVGVSADGSMLVGRLQRDGAAGRSQLEITDLLAGTARAVDIPFVLDPFVHFPAIRPDRKSALLFGRSPGDSTHKIIELRFDDGSARPIADVGVNVQSASVAISPDGSRIAYSTQPEPPVRNLVVIPIPRGRAPSRSPRP